MSYLNLMNVENANAMLEDLLAAFPDERVTTGQRIRRDQAARLNHAIARAKDIQRGMSAALDREIAKRG